MGLRTIRLPVGGMVGVEELFDAVSRLGSTDGPNGEGG